MSDKFPKGWKWVKLVEVVEYDISTIKQERLSKLIFENLAKIDISNSEDDNEN